MAQMNTDTSQKLATIREQTNKSIASSLLDIQKNVDFDKRSPDWVRRLECLEPSEEYGDETRLRRKCIDAFDKNVIYVAVSYHWGSSGFQDTSNKKYSVKERATGNFAPSKVTDQVLDRVVRYLKYCKRKKHFTVKGFFWIDQECINQEDSDEKECAIQSMDYVYKLSQYPVALLTQRIESAEDLDALGDLLSERKHNVSHIFRLLEHLTSDPWWSRAWTFQEDYRSQRMILLIGHHPSLEKQKRNYGKLGYLSGEICLKSTTFREKATKLCDKYKDDEKYKDKASRIQKEATKYTVLLKEGRGIRLPMSPTIFSDVGNRKITKESDRLAVIANCCAYSARLNTEKLNKGKCSMSLAMLCLFILNGEILMNGDDGTRGAPKEIIYKFLRTKSLRTLQLPDVERKLTFAKGCRLPKTRLRSDGIVTEGHLWRLHKILEAPDGYIKPLPGSSLNNYQRGKLEFLAEYLDYGDSGGCHEKLAQDLRDYLNHDYDVQWRDGDHTFSKEYKDIMAEEVVEAIRTKKSLRLACLQEERNQVYTPYRGIFVGEKGFQWTEKQYSYVFTAFLPDQDNANGIDKHVSLEVNLLNDMTADIPKLIVKRWINGLCFFNDCQTREVVFPWPKSFLS